MATRPKYTGVTPCDGGWQYRIKIKLESGKVVDTRIKRNDDGIPFLTAREAYEAKKAHEEKLRAIEEKPTETQEEPSVVRVIDVYENYMKTEGVRKAPATLRKQDSMWRNHVCIVFGERDINSITLVELQTFLFNVYKTHSYKYVEGFLKFFYLIFGHADRMEVMDVQKYRRMFVDRNTRLHMPEMKQLDKDEEKRGVEVYTDEEIEMMEKVFDSEDGNLLLAFHLGLFCGLRISECFGLRWRDIDFDKNIIHVNHQMQYNDGQLQLCGVKTLKSSRDVYITEDFKEELWFYYSMQVSDREKLGKGYRDYERVFDTMRNEWLEDDERDFVNRKRNGEILTTNSMKYWAKKINPKLEKMAEDVAQVKKMAYCGIAVEYKPKKFHYHSLRHTFATRCASNNMSLFMLMEILGHLKVETTKEYYINITNDYTIGRAVDIIGSMYTIGKYDK